MSRSGLKWGALLPLFVAAVASCSDAPPSTISEGLTESREELFGGEVVPGAGTIGENLATTQGIAGTVAEIRARTASTSGAFMSRCAGVVVARDRVLTSSLCVTDPENPAIRLRADQVSVSLPNPGGSSPWTSDVSVVWADDTNVSQPSDLAVLTLSDSIPFFATLGNVAPVFLGNIATALQNGALVADDAIVAGFGPECAGCGSTGGVRRVGPLGNPVFVDHASNSWWLASRVPANPGTDRGAVFAESTDPWVDGRDRGGPLFLREAASGRYVVAGTYLDRRVGIGGATYRFTFLGRIGSDPVHDHAELIREHLGDFIDGEACTPGKRQTSVNSNFEAEWWFKKYTGLVEEHLEDRCDPVPLTTFESSSPRFVGSPSAPFEFTTRTWLGKAAIRTEGQVTASLGFCSCFDRNGAIMPERECLENRCETLSLQDRISFSPFRKIEVYRQHSAGAWTKSDKVLSHVREGRLGDKEVSKWDWFADLADGRIDGQGGVAVGFLGTTGYQTWFTSGRDIRTYQYLRPTVAYLDLSPSKTFDPHPGILMHRCILPGCLPFVDPRDIFDNIPFASRFDVFNPVVMVKDVLGRVVIPRGAGVWQEVTPAIDSSVSTIISEADSTWIPAVEGADKLAASGIDERAVVVTSAGKILEIVATKDGLVVPSIRIAMIQTEDPALFNVEYSEAEAEASMANALLQAEAEAVAEVSLTTNSRALYSASEGVIYQVLGSDTGSGSITKTAVENGVSSTIVLAAPPAGEILGAAYTPENTILYTLEAANGGKMEARIVAYDLSEATSTTLWTVPYTATYDFTALSLTHEGELVLTASRGGSYTSWLIQAKSNGLPAFVGRLDGEGTPLDAPAMGKLGPTLPVLEASGEVRMDSLEPRDFKNGEPCTEL